MIEFAPEELLKEVVLPEPKTEINRLEDILKYLAQEYAERRTDVSDIAGEALEGKSLEEIKEIYSPESRYVRFNYQGRHFIYDTLTTLVETNGSPDPSEILDEDETWKTLKCEYDD